MPLQTPMMQQYQLVKNQHRDAILFFRLGDFYEMFFEDAEVASKELDLTLTSRNKNMEGSVPLCGVPVCASQGYIHRLLAKGYKVAICEQTEDPKLARGLVRREVVQVYTPGLVLDADCLDGKANHLIASIFSVHERWGLAFADISTGLFKMTEMVRPDHLLDEMSRLAPKEILISKADENSTWVSSIKNLGIACNVLSGWHYDRDFGIELYQRHYQVDYEGLHLSDFPLASRAGGAILAYMEEAKYLQKNLLGRPHIYQEASHMALDHHTKRNLELFETTDGEGSLFKLIDLAMSSMGSRCLRSWLSYPLLDLHDITQRQDAVEELRGQYLAIQKALDHMADLERIQNRIVNESASPRDVVGLQDALAKIAPLKEALFAFGSAKLINLEKKLDPIPDLIRKIETTLVPDPPLALKEGGLIKQGVNVELDELRNIEKNGKLYISQMEAKERETTGISSLKIRFNQVFGYYIEITHTHKDKIPLHYTRKQTLTNAERYITEELKSYEDRVLGASEKIRNMEYEIFTTLRQEITPYSLAMRQNAEAIGQIDALASLAKLSVDKNYTRPELTEECILDIDQGRHPLVEGPGCSFVPNNCFLDEAHRVLIITGPNMAGKSTVMRQVALITILAQIGSFVPASRARIGLVDRIFTRIGASDHLQKGLSTFMVEMLETAQILQQATRRSLVLLDEIGRGTSTFDGLSIAWAVAETLHDEICARTLFATHYHELTDLSEEKSGIHNFHMAVTERKGEIHFLRELKPGATNRSYGVSVAAMAGLPPGTISRAREILKLLEKKDLAFSSEAAGVNQPSLFDSPPWVQELKELSINEITPLEALRILAEFKAKL